MQNYNIISKESSIFPKHKSLKLKLLTDQSMFLGTSQKNNLICLKIKKNTLAGAKRSI